MIQKIVCGLAAGLLAISLAACSSVPPNKIKSADDLAGATIGVQDGTTGDIYVTDNVQDAKVDRYKKPTDAALALKQGKVDAVVLDEMPAKKIVEKNDDLMILDGALTNEDYCIAVAKGNTELLDTINQTLDAMTSDGSFDNIMAYYIMNEDVTLKDPENTKANGTITMGTNAEFEPFEYRSDSNEIIGIDAEMAKYIAASLGKELVIEDMAFDSLIAALSTGKVDMVLAGMTRDEEREKNVDFSKPYYNSSQVIVVRKK